MTSYAILCDGGGVVFLIYLFFFGVVFLIINFFFGVVFLFIALMCTYNVSSG